MQKDFLTEVRIKMQRDEMFPHKKKRKRKYGNVPVYECDHCGQNFKDNNPGVCNVCKHKDFVYHASTREFLRWRQLLLLEKGKFVSNLKRQVRLPIKINSIPVFSYVADFVYLNKHGQRIIEDSKGTETDVFKLKRKCVEAYYGFSITIT